MTSGAGGGLATPPVPAAPARPTGANLDPPIHLAKLPKRVARPGQRAKTRGLWVDETGAEHELVREMRMVRLGQEMRDERRRSSRPAGG